MLANSSFVDIELCGIGQLHCGRVISRRWMDGRGYVICLGEHFERIERERAEAVAVFIPIAVEFGRLDFVAQRDPEAAAVADKRLQTLNTLRIQLRKVVDDD